MSGYTELNKYMKGFGFSQKLVTAQKDTSPYWCYVRNNILIPRSIAEIMHRDRQFYGLECRVAEALELRDSVVDEENRRIVRKRINYLLRELNSLRMLKGAE